MLPFGRSANLCAMRLLAFLFAVLSFGCSAGGESVVDAAVDATNDGEVRDAAMADAAALPPRRDPWQSTQPVSLRPNALVRALPWVATDASPYVTDFDPAMSLPRRGARGGHSLGNGVVHAWVGIGEPDPLTWHEIVGPGYDKVDGYFADVTWQVWIDGSPWTPARMRQWGVRNTGVVVTQLSDDEHEVVFVDFAPWTRAAWVGETHDAAEASLVRLVGVRSEAASVAVRASIAGRPDAQIMRAGRRFARLSAIAEESVIVDGAVVIEASGAEWELAPASFAMAFGESVEARDTALAALDGAGALSLAQGTYDRWRGWRQAGARLESTIPKLDAFVDEVAVQIRAQTAKSGATCPMSRYGKTWLRDAWGPVSAFAALGLHDDANAMVDAQWRAIVARGDLANSFEADVPFAEADVPDFAALGPLEGRVRAEGPSHLVLDYDELARWSRDDTRLLARWPLLMRAATRQAVDEQGLLPFSGDETFRTAMAVALGFAISETFEDGYRSLDASALLMRATSMLAKHASRLGRDSDAALLVGLHARLREALDATYRRDDAFLPFVDGRGVLAEAPFEDASLKPHILGLLDDDRALAVASLDAMWRAIGTVDGFVVSPVHERNRTFAVIAPMAAYGLYTGMSPSHWLSATSRFDHALADDALDAIGRVVSSSGSIEEYMAFGDHSSIAISYSEHGTSGDYTARVRPWEGGLTLRSVLDALARPEPDYDAEGELLRLVLRAVESPSRWALRGLRVGDDVFDVEVDAEGPGESVFVVTHVDGVGAVRIAMTASLGLARDGEALVSCEAATAPTRTTFETRVQLGVGVVPLDVGDRCEVRVVR